MPERRLDARLSQWTVQTLTRLFGTYGIVQGFFIVLGGPQRWQSPGLSAAMSIPGAPGSWGVALMVLGAVALAGTFHPRMRVVLAGLLGIAAWDLFFAGTLAKVVLESPNVATTGVFVYSRDGIAACILAVAYWRSR